MTCSEDPFIPGQRYIEVRDCKFEVVNSDGFGTRLLLDITRHQREDKSLSNQFCCVVYFLGTLLLILY